MWFRRDLRLADLPALAAAAEGGRRVVPLYVVDPAFAAAGAPRRAALADALAALNASLGSALVHRHGDPVEVVPKLAAEVGATEVFVTRDGGPYGHRRDAAVAEALRSGDRRLVGVGWPYAVAPGAVLKGDGSPYAVFTPFSKAWRAVGWDDPIDEPDVEWYGAPDVGDDGPPTRGDAGCAMPAMGERAAHDRWDAFVADGLDTYDETRNLPGTAGTSRLSVDLRWGTIHPRQLLDHLGSSAAHQSFANELAWREFYADVLRRRPESASANLDERMNAMPVDTDAAAKRRFDRWTVGATGFPFVDAGMRQLTATGWMHNRVRMVVASFLVKDLHLPWQWGARHFMRHLVDGDLASNSHGWQWAAGTGTDAAPYFRVFNPTSQGERFDPDGEYIERWVPERATEAYPAPMVDHRVEREEALARYRVVTASTR